jgi:hypothetical protein
MHLDLHVDDPRAAHEEVIALGAQLLQPAPDLDAAEGHQVYAIGETLAVQGSAVIGRTGRTRTACQLRARQDGKSR